VSTLVGAKEMRARLRAMRKVWKPVGRTWRDEAVMLIRPQIPTGKTRRSVQRGRVTTKRAEVKSKRLYIIRFLDQGTKPHDVAPRRMQALKFAVGGNTVFARKARVRGIRGRHFREEQAERAFEKTDVLGQLTKLWNDAA